MSKLNISRRDFLKAAGVSAAALGLTACGGSSSSTAASGSASAAGSTASAGGSNWPTDTVSFYVPAKAGGGTDMTARVFLQGINEVHPGNYIVVNDVTGGGTVAAENVRNAKPDGLNLLAYHTGLCTSFASGQYAHDLSEFTICGMFITVPDEATGGLDPVVRDEVLTLFSDFTRSADHAVLISSHIVSDLEKICDYIAFIHQGRLLLCEEKDRLYEQYRVLHTDAAALSKLDAKAVIGVRKNKYDCEAIVKADALPQGAEASPIDLEQLLITMVKGEKTDDGTSL